jgi:hypothetical protein
LQSARRVAAEHLLRLEERPVRHQRLALTDPDDAGSGGIVELEAVRLDALPPHPLHQRVPARQRLLALLLRLLGSEPCHSVPLLRGVVQKQQVLHAAASSRPARSSIAPVDASTSCAESSAASSRTVAVEQVEAAEDFLRLGERAVGDDVWPLADATVVAASVGRARRRHDLRGRRPLRRRGGASSTSSASSGVSAFPLLFVAVDEDQHLHCCLLRRCRDYDERRLEIDMRLRMTEMCRTAVDFPPLASLCETVTVKVPVA